MFILIGAGGHSKVIIDILLDRNEKILGIVDDNKKSDFEGFDVLGNISELPEISKEHPYAKFIIAIGNNEVRKKIALASSQLNISFGTAIHPSAIIGRSVTIKEGTVIMAGAIINRDACIGRHNIINTGSTIDHECRTEDYVHISPGVNLAGNVKVGELTHMGIGSTCIQGIEIGSRVMVGAGATVINDIDDDFKVIGTPAKPLANKRGI